MKVNNQLTHCSWEDALFTVIDKVQRRFTVVFILTYEHCRRGLDWVRVWGAKLGAVGLISWAVSEGLTLSSLI